ncbi:hypothetical protein COOONC_27276 [Cooperia oncophora]
MATLLSSRQGLLTKSVNRLAAVVDEYKDLEAWELEPPSEDHERRTYLRTERMRIWKIKAILESETSNVDTALERYSSAADSLDASTPSLDEILEKVCSNTERAAATLDKGRVILTAVDNHTKDRKDSSLYIEGCMENGFLHPPKSYEGIGETPMRALLCRMHQLMRQNSTIPYDLSLAMDTASTTSATKSTTPMDKDATKPTTPTDKSTQRTRQAAKTSASTAKPIKPSAEQTVGSKPAKIARKRPATNDTTSTTSAPKRQRNSSSSSSSSSSSTEEAGDIPPKKGRASGTILKELLLQGSRTLHLAASKVDQLAPAVTTAPCPQTTERLQRNEDLVRAYHLENMKRHKTTEGKLDTLSLKLNILTDRFEKMEKEIKERMNTASLEKEHATSENHLRDNLKELRGAVDNINSSQLSLDSYSSGNASKFGSRLSEGNTVTTSARGATPRGGTHQTSDERGGEELKEVV